MRTLRAMSVAGAFVAAVSIASAMEIKTLPDTSTLPKGEAATFKELVNSREFRIVLNLRDNWINATSKEQARGAYFSSFEGQRMKNRVRLKDYEAVSPYTRVEQTYRVEMGGTRSVSFEIASMIFEEFPFEYGFYDPAGVWNVHKFKVAVVFSRNCLADPKLVADVRSKHESIIIDDGFVERLTASIGEPEMKNPGAEPRVVTDVRWVRIEVCPLVMNGVDVRDKRIISEGLLKQYYDLGQ